MTRRLVWPTVACVSGAVLDLLVFAGAGGPARIVVALWFLFVCIGMSIVPVLGISAPGTELLIGVTAGVLIDTLVATALAATGHLTTVSALIVLQGVCLLGSAFNVSCSLGRSEWSR